jgi:hypothetical protein
LDQQKSISRIETHVRTVFPAPAEYFAGQPEMLMARFSYIRIPEHHRIPPEFNFQSLNLGSSSSHCPVPCWRVLEMSCCRRKKLSGDNHSIIASCFAAIESSISESMHSLSLYQHLVPLSKKIRAKLLKGHKHTRFLLLSDPLP